MLSVIMLSVIMLSVIMLSVIMLNVIILSVTAPYFKNFKIFSFSKKTFENFLDERNK
jgi:hypothetical protein